LGVGTICLFIGHATGTTICIYMYFAIKMMKKKLTKDTYRLQKVLHLSVVLEFGLCTISMALPLTLVVVLLAFPIPYGSCFIYTFFMLASFQTSLSTIAQCYFIRPFRRCVKNILLRAFKVCFKEGTQTTIVVWATKNSLSPTTNVKR
jgi:hypothetical protein